MGGLCYSCASVPKNIKFSCLFVEPKCTALYCKTVIANLPGVKLNAGIVPFTEELIGQFRMIMVVSVLVHVGSRNKCAVGKNQFL